MTASARTSVGALAVLVAGFLEEVQTAAGTKLTVVHEGEEDPRRGAFVRFSVGVEYLKRERHGAQDASAGEPCMGKVTVSGLLVVGPEQAKSGGIYSLIDRCSEKLDERYAVDADGNQIDLFRPRFGPPATVPADEERAVVVAEFEIMGTCQRPSGATYTDFLTTPS